MKKIFTLLLIVAIAMPAMAQKKFDFSIETKPTDIKGIAKRKLVVELLEENNDAIAELVKWRADYPNGEANYRNFIKTYNEFIQKAVAKYWKLNTVIEYKKAKEVNKLIDSRDKNSFILSAQEVGGTKDYITRFNGTAVMLVFFRADKGPSTIDYKIMLPYSGSREDNSNIITDFYFTIQNAAANMSYMEDAKKTSDFLDYMESMVLKNCTTAKDKVLLIDRHLIIKKVDKKEVKEYYEKKKFEISETDAIQTAVEGEDASKSYTVLIPYSSYQNMFDPDLKTSILCYKVIVNAADGTPLHYIQGKAKGNELTLIVPKDFKELGKCSDE